MAAAELIRNVGKVGLLTVDGLQIEVLIQDARQVWDRLDYLVTPVRGTGQQWVSAQRVTTE